MNISVNKSIKLLSLLSLISVTAWLIHVTINKNVDAQKQSYIISSNNYQLLQTELVTLNVQPTHELDIINSMNYSEKVIMLDHDDLFSALTKKGESPLKFKEYINSLQNFCFENNVTLLRTVGVIFSDMEKRETQYMK